MLSICVDFEVPSDTKAAMLFLKSVVPLSKFEGKIPAIILKHQIYCVVKDKTLVDRQLVSFKDYILPNLFNVNIKGAELIVHIMQVSLLYS